jgi:carboxyl-terminal processing protease
MLMRKRPLFLSPLLVVVLFAPLACAKATSPPGVVSWEPIQGKTASEIVAKLEHKHYDKQPLNDVMSAQLLDAYLKSLDPSRLFLLQSDIDGMQRYRTTLDDSLHKGDMEPGFAIFRRYQQRVEERLQKILTTLPATLAAMDFTKDEYLDLDRDKNPTWPKTAAEADELWRLRLKNTVLSLRLAGK